MRAPLGADSTALVQLQPRAAQALPHELPGKLGMELLAAHPLRNGLSTTVTVDTSHAQGATLDQPMVASALYTTRASSQPVADAEKLADTIIAQNLAH